MALTDKSLFLYGLQVNQLNSSIDFKISSGGPILQATVTFGFYSLSGLASAIQNALVTVDPTNVYLVTVDRSLAGGTQNRVTIASSSSYFSLLFGSGPRSTSAIAPLIGFSPSDYTGATMYTGSSSAGTPLITAWWGKNYSDPNWNQKNFGSVNVTTAGVKESITFALQYFIEVEFQYELQSSLITGWQPLIQWMIQQRAFDFTPQISSYNTFYQVTLEKSSEDGKGLGFKMKEQLPDFPFLYTTGPMTFRVVNT